MDVCACVYMCICVCVCVCVTAGVAEFSIVKVTSFYTSNTAQIKIVPDPALWFQDPVIVSDRIII